MELNGENESEAELLAAMEAEPAKRAYVRTGKNTQHSMVALMRQSIFSRLAGYEDTNDAERLLVDPPIPREECPHVRAIMLVRRQKGAGHENC